MSDRGGSSADSKSADGSDRETNAVAAESDPVRGLLDDLESQRKFVQDRVPVYARILGLLPDVLPRDRLAEAWKGRTFGAWYERPLLILASLRDDTLEEGATHPLHTAIGDARDGKIDSNRSATVTPDEIRAALEPGRSVWDKLRQRHVQTNETSRAVAWMWPAHLIHGVDPKRELHLFDVGASAGLNLVADALPRIWTRSDGNGETDGNGNRDEGGDELPLAIDPLPEVATRRGFDLRPLDPDDEESARWLRACVWPGQQGRLRRLDQAIRAWRSTEPRPELVRAAAGEVPNRLPTDEDGWMLAYQTVMRDYLPPEEWDRYSAGMRRWLESSPRGRSLWVELEVQEAAREGGPPAAMTVHLRDRSLLLATCDPHPGRLNVDDEAVEKLVREVG